MEATWRCAACGMRYPRTEAGGIEDSRSHDVDCQAIPPRVEQWNPEAEHGWDYWDLMAL